MESVLIAILFGYILILIEVLPVYFFAGAVLVATFRSYEFVAIKYLLVLLLALWRISDSFLEFKWLAKVNLVSQFFFLQNQWNQ